MEDPNAFGVGSVDAYNKQGQGQNIGEENPTDGNNQKDPFYTMPGVLQFLQTEWSKFEMERSQWEVERAELQARIAFLQGERKGQENLKHDLVRRIKMLEFALRQERAKFHRLKFGSEPPGGAPAATTAGDATDGESGGGGSGASPSVSQLLDPEELLRETSAQTAATKAKAKDGRQLIRQYLQEIGYVDTILDARQARLQQLMGAGGTPASAASAASASSNEAVNLSSAICDSKQQPMSQQQQPPPPPSHQQHQQQMQPHQQQQQMRQLSARSQQQQQQQAPQPQQQQQRGRSIQEQLSSLIPGINIAGDDDEDDEDDDADDADEDVGSRFSRGGVKAPLSEEDQVIAEFDFLVNQQDADDQPSNSSADVEDSAAAAGGGEGGSGGAAIEQLEDDAEWSMDERTRSKVEAFKKERIRLPKKSGSGGGGGGGRGMLDAFLDEFGGRDGGEEGNDADDFDGASPSGGGQSAAQAAVAAAVAASEEEGFRSAMGLSLGDLQDITVANERDYDDDVGMATGSASSRRTWNSKFNLRSHLDSVRSLAFHPSDSSLLTASEDGTMKLWNLCSRAVHQEAGSPTSSGGAVAADSRGSNPGAAAGPQVELEPVHTYRGHAGPVLTVCVSPDGGLACTGGLDGCVRVWRLPPSLAGLDQYDAFDASLVGEALEGHRDAVWSLAAIGPDTMFSVGADSTLRAWRTRHHGNQDNEESASETPLLRTSQLTGRPTSLAVVPADPGKLLVSMATGADSASCLLLVDAETGQTVLRMPTAGEGDAGAAANRVVAHPTQATAIAGYSDRCIRCYDYASGELTHSMVAHLDSVTSLAVDPNGLYLISGSHDASLRVWSLDDPRSCVQEISAHRRKFDEAVHDVALHPVKSLMASAGADAVAKVFV